MKTAADRARGVVVSVMSLAVATGVAVLAATATGAPKTAASEAPTSNAVAPIAASGSAGAAPTASSAASGAPAGALAPIEASDLPAEPSDAPAAGEWRQARAIAPTRGQLDASCRMKLLREWIAITCAGPGAGLVAGDPKLARTWSEILPAKPDGTQDLEATVEVPVRRGQAFILSFLDLSPGYSGASTAEGQLVQVAWRDGAAEPLVVAYARR